MTPLINKLAFEYSAIVHSIEKLGEKNKKNNNKNKNSKKRKNKTSKISTKEILNLRHSGK